MTIGSVLAWLGVLIVATVLGAKGGVLLVLSRAIDNTRAAIRCAGLSWSAARDEWYRQWDSCIHWAQRER